MENLTHQARQNVSSLKLIHYAVPLASALYFFVVFFIAASFENGRTQSGQHYRRLRIATRCLTVAVFLSYVVDSASLISSVLREDQISPHRHSIIYASASSLLWCTTIISHFETAGGILDNAHYGHWSLYLISEIAILVTSATLHLRESNLKTACRSLRLLSLGVLLCMAFAHRVMPANKSTRDEENAPLLGEATNGSAIADTAYGSCNSNSDTDTVPNAKKSGHSKSKVNDSEDVDDDNADKKGFREIARSFRALMPFFWPSKRPDLQILYVGIAFCLAMERIMNIAIPLQIGLITNILSDSDGYFPWKQILVFISLRVLDSSGGLSTARGFMWIPLENFSYQNLSTTAFNHIMSLSCSFHDGKHSGKLWQAVIRGQYVKDAVKTVFFRLAPMVIDLALAVSVLCWVFDIYMAMNVAAVAVLFLWSSSRLVAKQRQKRKEWVTSRTEEFSALCESTGNWRTVSYFNRVPYEQARYASLVKNQLNSHWGCRVWSHMESSTQSILLTLGLMVACFMATYRVATGERPIGSFIMLLSYWAQLSAPLQFIASGFGEIARDLVDVEEYLELLREKPTITDRIDAKPLALERGEIKFAGVNFSYDGKKGVLHNINFSAQAGRTTALVGQTGGGKSTILKMIFRFYDPSQGVVSIDGQDISGVALDSLRESIGVVPQDPALFNDTIMNNIRYARPDATDIEIMEACKAVDLHEKFSSLTDGYDTIVGERGVRLSGGEQQRVAIAQAILKNPKIVLLDEATSSVDSETEARVQESLKTLTAGRTTLVIAHRLSTIVNADHVVVINNGEIVEQGRHLELMQNKGYYRRLCVRQGFIAPEEPLGDLLKSPEHGLKSDMPSTGNNTGQTRRARDASMPDSNSSETRTKFSRNQPKETCHKHQNGSSLRNHLKPDAPEFIPQAYKTGSNRSPSPGKTDAGLLGKLDHSSLDYETETDESFQIETGSIKEGCRDSLLTTILKGQDGIAQMHTKSTKNGVQADSSVTQTETETGPRNDGAEDSALSQAEEPVDLLATKKRVLRRKLSRSEPLHATKQPDDNPEGSTDPAAKPSQVASEVTTKTKQPKTSTNQRRRRRKNNWRNGKPSHSRSSTDWTRPSERSADP